MASELCWGFASGAAAVKVPTILQFWPSEQSWNFVDDIFCNDFLALSNRGRCYAFARVRRLERNEYRSVFSNDVKCGNGKWESEKMPSTHQTKANVTPNQILNVRIVQVRENPLFEQFENEAKKYPTNSVLLDNACFIFKATLWLCVESSESFSFPKGYQSLGHGYGGSCHDTLQKRVKEGKCDIDGHVYSLLQSILGLHLSADFQGTKWLFHQCQKAWILCRESRWAQSWNQCVYICIFSYMDMCFYKE